MLKRQDSQLSSSSRREVPFVDNRKPRSVGCVSTIFHLLSKYQNRRKFLTFGKKHEKISSEKCKSKAKKALPVDHKKELVVKDNVKNKLNKKKEEMINCDAIIHPRLSCEVPRSPVLPPEIRRPNSPEIIKARSPTLVARLMGLEEVQYSALAPYESTSQKRRKLLGVLEKCDEDLKMLKKVLENVRSVQNIQTPALKEDSRKSNNNECRPTYNFTDHQAKKRNTGKISQQNYTLTKKPGENDVVDLQFLDNLRTDTFQQRYKSSSMIASINEVCNDVEWGEKREIGKIGLVIQDYICRDLIEEIVVEFRCFFSYSLPFESCKRRLCF